MIKFEFFCYFLILHMYYLISKYLTHNIKINHIYHKNNVVGVFGLNY